MAFELLPQQFGVQSQGGRGVAGRTRPIALDAPDDVDVADPLTIVYVTGHTRKSRIIRYLKLVPSYARISEGG